MPRGHHRLRRVRGLLRSHPSPRCRTWWRCRRIATSHAAKTKTDYLTFGATVWVGGNGPLDVEGFRSHGSPIMKAYQYFWQGKHLVGRVRAGTMGFDSQKGHNHWHSEQFAKYTLPDFTKSVTVTSHQADFASCPRTIIDPPQPRAV